MLFAHHVRLNPTAPAHEMPVPFMHICPILHNSLRNALLQCVQYQHLHNLLHLLPSGY